MTKPRRNASALAMVLLASACGMPLWNPPPVPPEPATPPPSSPAAITAIYLSRTACFGTCPHYHLLLRPDGSASYVGVTDAPRVGTYESHLPPATFQLLASAIVRNGFFDLPNSFGIPIDAPSTIVTVTVQDPLSRRKTTSGSIPDHHYLWPLAARLDSLAATLPWQWRSRDTLPPRLPGDGALRSD